MVVGKYTSNASLTQIIWARLDKLDDTVFTV